MLLPFELKVFIHTVQFKKTKIIVLSWFFCILFWHSGAMLLVLIAVNLAFWRLWLHSCYVQTFFVFVFVNIHFFSSTTLNIKFVCGTVTLNVWFAKRHLYTLIPELIKWSILIVLNTYFNLNCTQEMKITNENPHMWQIQTRPERIKKIDIQSWT